MKLLWVCFGVLGWGGAQQAMAIEEPKFTVVEKKDEYEIRAYGKVIVAETLIEGGFEDSGNRAFRILADYIFGNNRGMKKIEGAGGGLIAQEPYSQKIAMTAPVGMEKSGTGYRVQFTMPSEFTMETLPQPVDPNVKIRELPPRKVAVYRYSGSWSEDRYREKKEIFSQLLEKDGVKTRGEPLFARFNSPFMIWFLRRNEIWIELLPQ